MSSVSSNICRSKRQTLLFSATIPKEIAALADSLLTNPARISITPSAKPVEKIEQKVFWVEKAEKRELLIDTIRQSNVHQTLVFTRTKHGADRVARDLNRAGIAAKAIHGDKSQNQRQRALEDLRRAKSLYSSRPILLRAVLISVNCRWLSTLTCPIFRKPMSIALAGQVVRGGRERRFSFCSNQSERPYLADIEKLIGKRHSACRRNSARGERKRTGRPGIRSAQNDQCAYTTQGGFGERFRGGGCRGCGKGKGSQAKGTQKCCRKASLPQGEGGRSAR